MPIRLPVVLVCAVLGCLPGTPRAHGQAADAAPERGSLFRDTDDGQFDMSRWLLEHRGFLPVPIIVSDPIPFYRLPYIDLRGIGSARYQDTRVGVLETELRWNMTSRWALVGFVGAGRTWGRHNSFSDGGDEVAKGAGVRYLIARQLGVHVGVDYAWGPEDQTFYVQVGSPWR